MMSIGTVQISLRSRHRVYGREDRIERWICLQACRGRDRKGREQGKDGATGTRL